jgi:hypothetical protein
MSKKSTASRFTLFVIALVAIAGFTAMAAQYHLLPSLLRKSALLTPHAAHRLIGRGPQEAAATPVDEEGQPPRVRITQPIDESVLVTLPGNTRPEADRRNRHFKGNDRGAVYDALSLDHMLLQLQRSPEKEQEFQRVIDDLNDKTSANFHHWLTADEIGQRFGVADEDVKTVTGWLESHGFRVNQVYPATMMIDFSGTAGQVKQAFHTEIHNLNVHGEPHIANTSDPQIPAALAPVVAGPVSLNDFKPHPMYKVRPDYTFGPGCTSATGTGTCYSLTAGDTETIYNLNPVFAAGYSGQGQTVVVVEDTDTYDSTGAGTEWTTYRNAFGLATAYPAGSYTEVHPSCTDPGHNGDDGEAAIDVEMATTTAPSATVELASCASGTVTFGGLIALQGLVNGAAPYPGVVSVSYGVAESVNGNGGNQAFYNTYQAAAAEGTTVFGSSGDGGPSALESGFQPADDKYGVLASLSITGWAETPYNVAIGGTDFEDVYDAKLVNTLGGQSSTVPVSTYWNATNSPTYKSAKSYIPEIPWNLACASVLIAEYVNGSFTTYGSGGFCNVASGDTTSNYMVEGGAAGGASNCATGWGGATTYLTGTVAPECQGYAKPAFQSGSSLTGGHAVYGQPSDGVRDIPDVSLFASNGVWGHFQTVCWNDPSYTSSGSAVCTGAPSTWSGFGGTSVGSPTMAGIQALVNQRTAQNWGIGALTNYYQIGQSEYGTAGGTFQGGSCNSSIAGGPASTCVWNDVTQGDINEACQGNTSYSHCYDWNTANRTNWGVTSTDSITTGATGATILWGGSGYTTAPTCTIAGPSNNNPYKAPSGTTLYAGGTQATCTATVNSGMTNAVWTVLMENSSSGYDSGQSIVVSGPTGGSPTTYTLPTCTTGPICATDLNNLVTSTPNAWATATVSSSTVTFTAKAAGAAGNFMVGAGTSEEFGGDAFQILNTVKGQGPNYVSGITIVNGGSGYSPETPITFGGPGTGAVAVANTTYGTAAASYQPSYGAAQGWDMATGLGSPNAYNLVNAFLTPQTITFSMPAPSTAANGTNFNVAATASSGLTVAFTASGVCSVVDHGNGTATYTMTAGSGTCDVIANQAGNNTYQAAPTVTEIVTATNVQNQTITFTVMAPTSAVYNTNFNVAATASSNLTVAFTSSGVCSVVDHLNGMATYTMTSGTGTCTVIANQPGNANYNPAPQVTETTTAAKATPTTTFTGAPMNAAYNTQFTVNSGTNASTTASITSDGVTCSGSGTGSAQITMIASTGTCTTTANWAADSNYSAATMQQTTTATTASQTITVTQTAPGSAVYNSSFNVAATASSGLTVAFTSGGVCSVVDHLNGSATYTMTSGTGTCDVYANQAGNGNFGPAPQVTETTTAQLATPTVSFTGAPSSAAYGMQFGVTSSTNASTAAAISGDNTTCSGSGTATATITMIAPSGTCTTTAVWPADNNYSSATATQTTTATQASTATVLTTVNNSLNPGQSTTLTATVTPSPAGVGVAPTGSVTFYLNGNALTPTGSLGAGAGNSAIATYTLQASQLQMGSNSLYAAYPAGPPDGQGDTNYLGSDSSATPITITLGTNNLSFGNVNVGSSASGMAVTYNFTANETLSAVNVVTTGLPNLDFTDAGGDTCVVNQAYTAGQSCTVNVGFTPLAPGVRSGAVVLFAQGQTLPLATFYINGTGESSAATVDPGTQTTLGTIPSENQGPVAVDAAGNAYIGLCVGGNCEVIEIAAQTQTQTTVLSGVGGIGSMALDGAGNLYLTVTGKAKKGGGGGPEVEVVPNEMGTLNANDAYTVTGDPNESPLQVSVDASGDVYILEGSGKPIIGEVVEVPFGGTATTLLSGLTRATSLAVDAAGDCYIGSTSMVVNQPGQVNEYTGCSGSPTQIGSGFQDPSNLAFDASGTLYVLDATALQVYAVTPGAVQSTIPTTGLNSPAGLALDGSANLYISDTDGNGNALLYEVNRTLPLPLAFPSEPIGMASPAQTVTVSNVGNQQLAASNLVIPTNFILTPSGGTDCSGSSTLNAAAACLMAIEFDPTTTGPLSGQFTLTDNALNNPASMQSVSVSGNGGQDSQTITFSQNAPPNAVYNTSFSVAASASSGLTVAFTASGVCTVNDNGDGTASYTMTSGTGSCSVIANQPGNGTYSAAPQVTQSTTAQLATPTTNFTGAPTSAAYNATFGVTATTNASTSASITSSGACSGSGTNTATITMTSGTGTCSMQANWPADNNYAAASGSQSTSASTASQSITFTQNVPSNAAYNTSFNVSATASSSLTVAFTAGGVCSVVDHGNGSATYTMTSGTGVCDVYANQAGNTNYSAAAQVTEVTNASLATPTTTFTGAPMSAAYNTQFTVSSTTNASTTASITSDGVTCSGSGTSSAQITMISGTGTCTTTANWAADNNYAAASASQTTTAQLANPTVTFTGAPTSAPYNGTFTVTATTNDNGGMDKHQPHVGNPAAITASGACTVPANSQNTALVTMTSGTGTCSLTATWQADNNYNGATLNQSTTATAASQSITFAMNAPQSEPYNGSFNVSATASSGLTVAFTASGVCSVVDHGNGSATYTMTSGTGSCSVIANQAGNTNYSAATQVTETTNATGASQSITFTQTAPPNAAYNSSFNVSATASSGLTVAFTASGVCSVVDHGNGSASYTMTSGTGSCSVMANQAGNTNYSAATQVTETTNASLATPTVTFTGAPTSEVYWGTFGVSTTTNASTSATITSSGVCTGSGTNSATVQMTSGTGSCSMSANWPADSNYAAASAMQSTTATRANSHPAFSTSPNPSVVNQQVTLSATVTKPNGPNNGVFPTGTIQFEHESGSPIGMPVTLSPSAEANKTKKFTPAKTYRMRAVYSGDSNFLPSTSNVVKQVVNP